MSLLKVTWKYKKSHKQACEKLKYMDHSFFQNLKLRDNEAKNKKKYVFKSKQILTSSEHFALKGCTDKGMTKDLVYAS